MALAGPLLAQPAPHSPLAILDVPYISQSEALCGGAAAAMVLRYWGERGIDAESFAHLVDRSAAGIRTDRLIDEIHTRGWQAFGIQGSSDQVSNELGRGRPVLTLIEDRPGAFHYIVIVGATSGALVFHDPARAPLRVMLRDEFSRRWNAAGRWMAVIVPGEPVRATAVPPAALAADTPCERLIARGIEDAQANDLPAAERALASALSCPGGAAMRELAGVRLLQRRWEDVETLASGAVAVDPADAHAWRLLATSRFIQDDRVGALAAWNRVSEPRLDLVSVAGLRHTRQGVVERLLAATPGDVLRPATYVRAQRRLGLLPAAATTRLEYVPVPSGLAELRASVNERPRFGLDPWGYAAVGLRAAARQELEYAIGSLTGEGERFTAAWRFWPHRPRVAASLGAPSPWGGVWTLRAFSERQPFDRTDFTPAERTVAELEIGNWITAGMHAAVRAGLDEWKTEGRHAAAGATLRFRSLRNHLEARLTSDVRAGATTFGQIESRLVAVSDPERRGRVYLGRAGVAVTSGSTPVDLWFAGDAGDTRDVRLRAHPLVRDGRFSTEQLGRTIVHGSAEGQQWWTLSAFRVGAAVFLDAARVGSRLAEGARGDVDVGTGARFAVPGAPGTFRADVAKGLRDGATKWSFVYEP
jgi:hypothetical protein